MQVNTSMEPAASGRPQALKSMSFSRFDSPRIQTPNRSRASTLQDGIPEILLQKNNFSASPEDGQHLEIADPFAGREEDENIGDVLEDTASLPQRMEDLPIEIRSLTERFLESLTAKIHPTPLGIQALSITFQDFYVRVESHISTHIAALSSKLSRDRTSKASVQARVSRAVKKSTGDNVASRDRSLSDASRVKGEQQMMSTSELLDKRKARKLLELKRVALEEAVERAVCEKLYARLYHHRSTDDRERDQKLRSRVAALSVVGIGLKELLVTGTSEDLSIEVQTRVSEDEQHIKQWLSSARQSIKDMSEARYPAAKILHLTAAHKSIVETLGKIFPASSSADEILPTLIYTLLTIPPSEINVISDLNFVQRFRASNRLDGETAYCLVNLEASISFLETVDLPSLRKGERSEGPQKTSRPGTPRVDSAPMQLGITPVKNLSSPPRDDSSPPGPKTQPLQAKSPRRLSTLTQPFQTGAARFEAASDSFRNAVLDSADQTLEALNNTVESSFRFMFGRLKEQQSSRSVSGTSIAGSLKEVQSGMGKGLDSKETLVEMPKTLEDARKLVNPTPLSEDLLQTDTDKDDATSIGNKTDDGQSDTESTNLPKSDSSARIVDLFGGRRQMRDHSVDSSRSGISGISSSSASKKVAFADSAVEPLLASAQAESPLESRFPGGGRAAVGPLPSISPSAIANNPVESLRGLGNSLNPFNRISAVGGLFSRSPVASPGSNAPATFEKELPTKDLPKDAIPVALTPREARSLTGIEELKKLAVSGNKKFLDLNDARDMKVGEIDELLKAYQSIVASVRSVVDN